MRPQFYDFIELFQEKITVDYISSDVECWECDSESREKALRYMKDKNYDLLGIRKKGKVINKVLTNKGTIEDINPNEIIPKKRSITDLLDKFINEDRTRYFLKSRRRIRKIVTIGDLQKGPARLLLFGLIMNFEVVCIDFITKYVSNWQDLLDKDIFEKIDERYKPLKAQDLDIDILHCSYLDDKIEIIKNIEKFNDFCLVCKKDEGSIRYILKKLKNLRNNLAHSNHMRANFKEWDELLESIKICRILTLEMKRLL